MQREQGLCRLLENRPVVCLDSYTVIEIEKMRTVKSFFALCNVMDEQIICSGGQVKDTVTNSVSRISIEAGNWEELPPLNIARKDHASCAIDRAVFVFCGTAGDRRMSLNSIEKLNCSAKNPTRWQLIRVPAWMLSPRY